MAMELKIQHMKLIMYINVSNKNISSIFDSIVFFRLNLLFSFDILYLVKGFNYIGF